jgi:hypothetical protein
VGAKRAWRGFEGERCAHVDVLKSAIDLRIFRESSRNFFTEFFGEARECDGS